MVYRCRGRRHFRAAVVQLSNRVRTNWYKPLRVEQADSSDFGVSRRGTLAAAEIIDADGSRYTVVSMYGFWEGPHTSVKSKRNYADASVHRLISDLTVLVGPQNRHRVLAAGDLNILYGYGECDSPYWGARYATVFDRMKAMGLPFVGPQAPNGRCADPWPSELPTGSANVPTFRSTQMTPHASRQLDFVFASMELVPRLTVRALNDPDEWGPSDHCRVRIELR